MAEQGGLLSFLNSPAGQGLLGTVAGALAGGGNARQNVGRGLLTGLQAYGGAQDQQRLDARNARQDQFMGLQMDAMKRQQSMAEAAQAAQQQRQNYLGSVGQVTSPKVGAQPNQFDPMRYIGMGGSVDEAKALSGSQNWGKSAVKNYNEVRMPDGSVQIVGFDEFGGQVKTGAQPFKAPEFRDLGGKQVAIDPVTMQPVWTGAKTMTPGEAASNAVARANLAISQQRLALDRSQAAQPQFKDGQWVVPPRDMKPGETRGTAATQAVKDANDVLAMVKQARDIIPNATGSYFGAGADQVARAFGGSTDGSVAAAKLKALQGALIAKMPKMSGPQSDKDAARYEEAIGRLGDPTVPNAEKSAALDVVEEIQTRYASGQGGTNSGGTVRQGGASGSWGGGAKFLGFE